MTMRDRLAADLAPLVGSETEAEWLADRLIALGWVRLDEEALARALDEIGDEPEAIAGDAAALLAALREEP